MPGERRRIPRTRDFSFPSGAAANCFRLFRAACDVLDCVNEIVVLLQSAGLKFDAQVGIASAHGSACFNPAGLRLECSRFNAEALRVMLVAEFPRSSHRNMPRRDVSRRSPLRRPGDLEMFTRI